MTCCNCIANFENHDLRILGPCNDACCCKCLVDYLENVLEPPIKCIVKGCCEYISDTVIRECLTDDQIRTYDKLLCLKSSHESLLLWDTLEARARGALARKKRRDLEEQQRKLILLPNPCSFECPICYKFILPRKGVILRNCLCSICKDCLLYTIDAKENIRTMTCSSCGMSLDLGEIHKLLDEDKLTKMMIREAQPRFFQCKNGNCPGFWDVSDVKEGFHKCLECAKMNCLACQDIHEGVSCAEFKKTKMYTSAHVFEKIMNTNQRIQCYLCKKILIRAGGCGAMLCNVCGSQVCIFTGKIAGQHDPRSCNCKGVSNCAKVDQYCGCTSRATCHKDCLYGCFQQ